MSFFKENKNKRYVIKLGTMFVSNDPLKVVPGYTMQLVDELHLTDEIMGAWYTESLDFAESIVNQCGGEIYVLNVELEPVKKED